MAKIELLQNQVTSLLIQNKQLSEFASFDKNGLQSFDNRGVIASFSPAQKFENVDQLTKEY